MGEYEQHPPNVSRQLRADRERERLADRSRTRELSSPPSPPSDELAASIQASVTEVAIMWILHNWSRTNEQRIEPLDQQIKNFSTEALAAITSHCPMLRNAKQEHLWLIYLKGLLAAGTHPREQMITAIKAVGERSWIHASGKALADAPVKPADAVAKPAYRNLSDLDALEHISEALAAD